MMAEREMAVVSPITHRERYGRVHEVFLCSLVFRRNERLNRFYSPFNTVCQSILCSRWGDGRSAGRGFLKCGFYGILSLTSF